MERWWVTLLRQQQSDGFPDLAGSPSPGGETSRTKETGPRKRWKNGRYRKGHRVHARVLIHVIAMSRDEGSVVSGLSPNQLLIVRRNRGHTAAFRLLRHPRAGLGHQFTRQLRHQIVGNFLFGEGLAQQLRNRG